MSEYEELCKKKIGDMNEGELYVFAQGLLDEVWKFEDKNIELENINEKLSLALESAENKLEKSNNIIKEVREYIKEMPNSEYIGYWKKEIFEILDKVGDEK